MKCLPLWPKTGLRRAPHLLTLCALFGLAAGPLAAEVEIFRTDTQEAFLEGTPDGVRVDPSGTLGLATRIAHLAAVEEPFVFAAAACADGWVLGTGNAGRVLEIDRDGAVKTLFEAAEPEVFAVHCDRDGTVYAATSPDGKVYRLGDGEAEVVFDPDDIYIWDLARAADGRLLVATGLPGRLYAVGDDGKGTVLHESMDVHLRAVDVLPDGAVLAGTAGQGLVLRIAPDGGVRTLYDAAQPEVLAFAQGADGIVYTAVLASEASLVDLSGARNARNNGDDEESTVEVTVAATSAGSDTVGSRGGGSKGPRSVVLEIAPNGAFTEIARFADETVHALLWHDNALWIGSGQEGRIYRWADGDLMLEKDLEERQVIALVAGGIGAAAVTTDAAALYTLGGELEPTGTYTSTILDAGQVARFGSFFWQGEPVQGNELTFSFRSGLSATPDDTWTDWTAPQSGREVALANLSAGRYVQWKATFHGRGGTGPRLSAVELSYQQENLRPQITKLEVLDAGQVMVPSNFNPSDQIYEPWTPNREGIFTTLRGAEAKENSRQKTLWKKGYRTLTWEVEDANEDELVYSLSFRAEGEEAWLPMAEDLEELYYSFDATVLPDGRYRFRLTAADRPAHAAVEALSNQRVSTAVVIDHTPPRLLSVSQRDGVIQVEVSDELSPLRDAVASIDAGPWQPAQAADSMLDGRREALRINVPPDSRLVLLRLTDAAHNVITFDLLAGRR